MPYKHFPDRTPEALAAEKQDVIEAAVIKTQQAAKQAQQAQVVTYAAPVSASVPTGSLQALAQSILASKGLNDQWDAMNFIITRESGWDLYNWNGKSRGVPLSDNTSCGLVQALPCSKVTWGDATGQINWFITYTTARYGSIQGAYAHWLLFSWY